MCKKLCFFSKAEGFFVWNHDWNFQKQYSKMFSRYQPLTYYKGSFEHKLLKYEVYDLIYIIAKYHRFLTNLFCITMIANAINWILLGIAMYLQ